MNNQFFSEKYEILGEIARGGMGVVYKAMHKTLNRTVAIKILHPQYAGDPSFLKRFQREARAMARLDHENIIRVYDVAEDQGAQCIVMEFFPGKDLKQVILEKGPFAPDRAIAVALQMAEALTYAHAEGIVHRDIKPGNVMIDSRGRVKLADFGIAAATDEISVTATGQIIGTPEYMSPEQARGEAIDGRSDLYSLGIVLYEMLTATTPFERLSRMSIIAKLLYEPKEFELSFPVSVSASIQELVRNLLKKQAENRIPDAETLAVHMKNLAKESADPARSEGTLTSITPPPIDSSSSTEEESTAILPHRSDLKRSGGLSSPMTSRPLPRPVAEKSSLVVSESGSSERIGNGSPLSEYDRSLKRPPPVILLAGIGGLVLLIAAGLSYRSSSLSLSSSDSTAEKPSDSHLEQVTLPVTALPEPKKEAGADAVLVGKVNEMEAESRRIQDEVAQLHSEADRTDARHRAAQAYLQATEWESKGSDLFQEGSLLIGQKEYQEASGRLQEATNLLARALHGFKKAKEEAGIQIAKTPPAPPKPNKSVKRESQSPRKASIESPVAPPLPSAGVKGSEETKPIASPPPEPDREMAKQVPPSIAPPPSKPDIDAVGDILSKLKTAYEGRDMAGLWQISNLSDGRARILEEIFRDFSVVKVSIANFSLTGELVSANVVITKLVDREGRTVPPREEWRQSKVLIRKEGNRWGKVLW
jgi:serine/threonine protein kinase